jgi:DNA polymerase V
MRPSGIGKDFLIYLAELSKRHKTDKTYNTVYKTSIIGFMLIPPNLINYPRQVLSLPLYLDVCAWKVPAGFPSPAADHTQERVDLNKELIRNKDATYLFRVKGDSMAGVGIYEGDTLVVDRSVTPKHNHIVLALLNNEFTVKRLYQRGGIVKLIAENNLYPIRRIKEEDDFVVWGVVTFTLHKLC